MKLKEIPYSIFHSFRLRHFRRSSKRWVKIPVIISLTSIPSRLPLLDIVIASLLEQTSRPEKIILWLNYSLKNKIPKHLMDLQNEVFSIQYCSGTSSFRKLLPTLAVPEYKDSIIVTCDDDMIYPKNWLNSLYLGHLNHPECVISQVGRLIGRDNNKELIPYNEWEFIRNEYVGASFLPIGYGGVLYPKNIFNEQVFDEEVFMALCPKADDLWFKAMSYLNGKKTYCVSEKARPIPILRSQKVSLNSSNIKRDGNRIQWQALCKHYPSLRNI